MILCHCVGVTDATIKKLIENGASSVPEITRRCGAGRCCACCRAEIATLLGTAREPADNPELGHFTNDTTWPRNAHKGGACNEGQREAD